MLQMLIKHSASFSGSKILTRCKLRLCGSLRMQHQTKSTIIHDLINLKEKAINRKRMDPRVEKWKDFLIYSDYILRKSLKFGYSVNSKIKNEIERRSDKLKEKQLMETPALSVTLKYLRDDVKTLSEEESEEESTENEIFSSENENFLSENEDFISENEDFISENEDIVSENEDIVPENEVNDSKPIYMPYAAKDSFKRIEKSVLKPKIINEEPALNEKFKVLYEKYLEAVKDRQQNSEELKKKLHVRLGDDLSKIPLNWMTDYETFDDKFEQESWEAYYGTPNPNSKVSSVPCGGCGALLHCKDSEIPGYLPSELFENQKAEVLQSLICQRCHFMQNYDTALDVKVSSEEYPKLLSAIKEQKCAVILVVDLTDFPSSIWPDISSIIGRRTPIFVVGNKIDLLPQDSRSFFQNVKESLRNAVLKTGIKEKNIKHISLVSAKSGFGIEELINKLQNTWRHKGDVYLVGCTNVGKSSLFNTLLQSDYCRVQAVDLVQRATTSPWPGTTLNLLKFPLTNPQAWRVYLRTQRLKEEKETRDMEEKLRRHQFHVSRNVHLATLQGRIGKTFRVKPKRGAREDFSLGSSRIDTLQQFGINEDAEEFKYSKWCYDTPGSMQPDQILHFLTTDELMMTLPRRIIIPRTFVIHEGDTLFLAGMGRIDFSIVPSFLRITVFSSNLLPLTICDTNYADVLYRELLPTKAFGVPINKPERLKIWPQLSSKDMEVTGISERESAADVVLSSAGWVSLTPPEGEQVSLTAWTPEGRGLFLRTPALLKYSVNLRGPRVFNCPAYKRGKGVYVKRTQL